MQRLISIGCNILDLLSPGRKPVGDLLLTDWNSTDRTFRIHVLLQWLFTIFMMFLFTNAAPANVATPPLGDRTYVIDGRIGINHIILPGNEASDRESALMRDPIIDGFKTKDLPKSFVLKPKILAPVEKAAVLTFHQKAISGRYAKPRVDFKLDALPLKRASEELKIDAIGNILRSDALLEGRAR